MIEGLAIGAGVIGSAAILYSYYRAYKREQEQIEQQFNESMERLLQRWRDEHQA